MMTFARWNVTRRLVVGALGIILLSVASNLSAGNAAKVDQFFAQWDRADSPGAAVVVVKDGAVVYLHGYGCADLEHHIPITPQTLFDVASVAKQFTGLSVAMLIQQGKLSLDDDIHKHLPNVPDFGQPITIYNLLHHTSGLRDWPETLAFSDMDLEGPITPVGGSGVQFTFHLSRRHGQMAAQLDAEVGDSPSSSRETRPPRSRR